MGETAFFGYQEIGEKGFIRWSLEYTMEPIIECFLAIPPSARYVRPLGKLNAPCCVLGHIALNEERLLKGFAQGITDVRCPFPQNLFDLSQPPAEEQVRDHIPDSSTLVAYWREVRTATLAYLDSLTAEGLRRRAERSILREGENNRDNPIREFFIMAIQHQNCHWGYLRAICGLLDAKVLR